MNKTEALARLDALEKEAAALRSIIEAPEQVEKKPLVPYFLLRAETIVENYLDCRQTTLGRDFAEAFDTMLDLRRQPGSEAAEDNKEQWYIRGDGAINCSDRRDYKVQQISPMFDSKESAEAALNAVGWGRIQRMMNTLHGRCE